jgi:hypothetical protein
MCSDEEHTLQQQGHISTSRYRKETKKPIIYHSNGIGEKYMYTK